MGGRGGSESKKARDETSSGLLLSRAIGAARRREWHEPQDRGSAWTAERSQFEFQQWVDIVEKLEFCR
jgi:hypothetical protein